MTWRWVAHVQAVIHGLAALLVVPSSVAAQDVLLSDEFANRLQGGHRIKFDNEHQVLIAHRNPSDRMELAVAWSSADGRRSGQIAPLKDLSNVEGLEGLDIWNVAASQDAVVLAGVLQAGERRQRRPPRHVLLTYDRSGTLRSLWQVNPYHHHDIAVDYDGNVYALGHRMDGQAAANLIVKYSRSGVVEREFLSSKFFERRDRTVITGSPDGENLMWIDDNRLMVYLAAPQELFQFDPDGTLQRRLSLREALTQLRSASAATEAHVMNLVVEGESLLMQVSIWGNGDPSSPLARVPMAGGRPTVLHPVESGEIGTFDVPLVGKSGASMLFLNKLSGTILRR